MEIEYFHKEEVHNTVSADIVIPILLKLFQFNSILDVGCGIGTWLSVAKKLGVPEVLGIDGDYVDRRLLHRYISEGEFIARDLRQAIDLGRRFDLCLCLEVAEHLPVSSAETLVDSLVRHADTILFSAAIPGQGGQNHLNEQAPQYWNDKFQERGYRVYDPIRPQVWNSEEVEVWYKQNIFLFSKQELNLPKPVFTHLVHPELYQIQVEKKLQYQAEIEKIKSGRAKSRFYLKAFFRSLFK